MITIYHFDNVTYAYSSWWGVFKETVEYYKKHYNTKVVYKGNCNKTADGTYLYVKEFDFKMRDCELLIYDDEKDILKGISFGEHYGKIWEDVFVKRNNKNDLLLITQFHNWFNKDKHTKKTAINLKDYNFKVSPTVFYPIHDNPKDLIKNPHQIDYESLFQQRKLIKPQDLKNQLFMLFTTERIDPISLSKLGYLNSDLTPQPTFTYFQKLLQYKIGLAIGTTAEYSYREFEYMAIGLPFLRIEYFTSLKPPLIPNYHYISIDRDKYNLPHDNNLDRLGGDKYVKAYIDRFLEVKDDQNFLDFISKNAREYYIKHCSPQNRLNHMLTLLEEK